MSKKAPIIPWLAFYKQKSDLTEHVIHCSVYVQL